ncbi:class A beta-lactamase [Cryobacterium sp. PAMC25264]|uniref:class A beta-lactamase n=1 Tax=Cryobacterium sp. PAMC25264 TaxID=2861288 RepID=UPI001C62E175|nr:class A beta-lactamase [Cryobacterium sp. PAMC25264]QYF74404.1 class A beta-lactamase [Cryobacterium sp. PAMC25264]
MATQNKRWTTIVLGSLLMVASSGCTAAALNTPAGTPSRDATEPADSALQTALDELENQYDARIGLSVIDTADGSTLDYQGDSRFGYASTLKTLAAAALLDQTTTEELDRVITWSEADVLEAGYSPVTSEHLDTGLPLGDVAMAAIRASDNTAMNLMLKQFGGPAGLDKIIEGYGDTVTDVVDNEPGLNTVTTENTANTSTPRAFTKTLERIVSGEILDDADRSTLIDWMTGNATGDTLIRAGAPEGWEVADKSGGSGAIRNDVAVVIPPDGIPLIITVFTTRNDPDVAYDDALVAETARLALATMAAARENR